MLSGAQSALRDLHTKWETPFSACLLICSGISHREGKKQVLEDYKAFMHSKHLLGIFCGAGSARGTSDTGKNETWS